MNEFYNTLILKDEEFNNGWFPQIPNYKKNGVAYVLADGIKDDLLVDERTTTKEIRQGKYKRLIEISVRPYMEEIRFESASKENSFTFDIYVKAVIRVKNPIVFYNNRNLDVTSYFSNMFSLDVRKITRKYSILNYEGMDTELTEKLSSYNTVDDSTGFEYQISVVDAKPGKESREYVRKSDEQSLGAELKSKARGLARGVTSDYEEALKTQVIEGKISEIDAIQEIKKAEEERYEKVKKQILELRDSGLIPETAAREVIKNVLTINSVSKMPKENDGGTGKTNSQQDKILDKLYEED